MDYEYRAGRLYADGADLSAVAQEFGTPCYVYSRASIEARWRAYDNALATRAHRICYAVKANHNLSLLRLLQRLGSGFDIVSGGELERVLLAGARAGDVVFSGVGKSRDEIGTALAAGIACINVESFEEVERISAIAGAMGRVAAVAVRINPDVDAGTHPYISTGLRDSKFGLAPEQAVEIVRAAMRDPWLQPTGVACHIGSQLVSAAPVVDAVRSVVSIAETLRADGIPLAHIDVGGGLGVRYRDETPPGIDAFVAAVAAQVPAHYTMTLEPGRSLVAEAGMLLTRIEYVKRGETKNFVVVDAAMNDLIRPALYDAWHDVIPIVEPSGAAQSLTCDVVGPVCESGDWLARGRTLAAAPGELLAITVAGAYGHVMASNYNARLRPPEVLIDDGECRVIRARETADENLANERALLQA